VPGKMLALKLSVGGCKNNFSETNGPCSVDRVI